MINNVYLWDWIVRSNYLMNGVTEPLSSPFCSVKLNSSVMEMIIKRKGIDCHVLFDAEDYDILSNYFWHIDQDGYVVGYKKDLLTTKKQWVKMHRFVMHKVIDLFSVIDHINRNKLDNRKCNLRICTVFENSFNVLPFGKSKYRGVCTSGKKYIARITVNNNRIYLGTYNSEIEAANSYNEALAKYYPNLYQLNKVKPD